MQSRPLAPSVSDAPRGNWVDRLAPPAWRPLLRLSRADRPIGTWLLLLPCYWGTGLAMLVDRPRWVDLWVVVVCTLGAVLMRGAGCTWNDLTDREFDAMVARTRSRPLPSGQVTVRGAWIWMAAQAGLAAVLLFTLNGTAIALGIASLALVAVYPFAKRFTWWPQVFLGLAFNWGVLVAFAAHGGTLHPAAMLAYAAGISWTLFYDTIYAHQDTEDDALIGVKSTARLFGADTPRWLLGFAAGAVLLLAMAVAATRPGTGAALVAMLGVAGFAAHLWWQLRGLDTASPAVCLRLFRSNRDAGLIVALFLAVAALV
ncbi:4-hydroxybenzoate octaprenyltransferase [Paracoccus sanguinis]|uniref:4-hydroxybenzoate octaprenyltransferase n=1 Tax=Paracoccus sanguinis TaxID=1545044 RepID=A0A1H2U8L1_9RHOB|nr:4-hydroxybenzoate octaprenyltransferase [Paracoccus sanguinis]KGJ15487.1 4-hydroxybenzoate polyprenyltransferase [Paracoccus sanguinis]SDW52218.1 4-hydroxybenzoate polyprenyltransferase [Paracoccus sanguinis]